MTQTPITVTYTLEEVLGQINQKLDDLRHDVDTKFEKFDQKLDDLRHDVDTKFEKFDQKLDLLQQEVVEIKVGQTRLQGEMKTLESALTEKMNSLETEVNGNIKNLETEVKGIGKRLDTQEFINRSIVVGVVLTLVAGAIKMFFPSLSS